VIRLEKKVHKTKPRKAVASLQFHPHPNVTDDRDELTRR